MHHVTNVAGVEMGMLYASGYIFSVANQLRSK
jgi:hypothetical protein